MLIMWSVISLALALPIQPNRLLPCPRHLLTSDKHDLLIPFASLPLSGAVPNLACRTQSCISIGGGDLDRSIFLSFNASPRDLHAFDFPFATWYTMSD